MYRRRRSRYQRNDIDQEFKNIHGRWSACRNRCEKTLSRDSSPLSGPNRLNRAADIRHYVQR